MFRKKVYLFGASELGRKYLARAKFKKVLGFIDNDPEKWGGSFCGKTVFSPEELKRGGFDAILITSSFYMEISEQLEEIGISNYQVPNFVYRQDSGIGLLGYDLKAIDYIAWILAKKSFYRIICCLNEERKDICHRLKVSNVLIGGYPPQIDISYIQPAISKLTRDKTIMVAHSGYPGLNHRKLLARLKKFKNENIRVVCPMSYGKKSYIESIEREGKADFGDKFSIVRTHMDIVEYVNEFLSNIDVAIFDIRHNTALSTQWLLLYLGKKLYTSGISYKEFRELGLDVSNSNDIENENYQEFSCFGSAEKNRKIVTPLFDKSKYQSNWNRIFTELPCKKVLHIIPSSIFAAEMAEFFTSFFTRYEHSFVMLNGLFPSKEEKAFCGNADYEEINLIQGDVEKKHRQGILDRMRGSDLIIIYSFSVPAIRNMLLTHPWLFKKTMWHVWGQDDGINHVSPF